MDNLGDLPINLFDAGVIAVLLVSAFLAYARGFVHEVLSIGGWIGAIFATFYGFPILKPYARQYIPIELAADLTTGLILFVVSLVLFSYFTRSAAKLVQNSALNALDRALGFLFGLVRGAAIVCVAYIGLELAMPEDEHPELVKEARSMELIQPGAQFLTSLLPDEAVASAAQRAKKRTKDLMGASEAVDAIISPKPKDAKDKKATPVGAYRRKELKDMERLIDSSQNPN